MAFGLPALASFAQHREGLGSTHRERSLCADPNRLGPPRPWRLRV